MDQQQAVSAHESNVSDKVVEKVAKREGVDPLELTPPLFEVIDPDSLDHIFDTTPTGSRMDGQVTFTYNGYEVTVGADNVVEVAPE